MEQSNSFQRLMALPLERGRVLILAHQNPDPDTLASGIALQYLLEKTRSIDATVAYSGIIGRAENRAMVSLLDLQVVHLDEVDAGDFGHTALIDAQPQTGNNASDDASAVDIVIDHHPLRETTRSARFYDVREEVGASATILTEYLRAASVALPRNLATALLYGIRSETQDLGREVSPSDLRAYEYLFPMADAQKLAAIARPRLPRRYFADLASALGAIRLAGNAAVIPMAEVIDPDFVPEMADFAVRMEGIEWALAIGSYGPKLYLSIRTNDEEAEAGALMQKVVAGFGRGGGHGMRGGGAVELSAVELSREEVEEALVERFLSAVGEKRDEMQGLVRGT